MMRLWRKSAASRARKGALLLGLAGSLGCSTYETWKDVEPDCSAADAYDFKVVSDFETSDPQWWPSPDSTPGAYANIAVTTIPEGPLCGSSSSALVLSAGGNNDWGCVFGPNAFIQDASQYEGLSFWAMAPGNTAKGFQIILNDPNTVAIEGQTGNCIDLGGGNNGNQTVSVVVDGQSVSTSGAVTRPTLPNECGNGYSLALLATTTWQLYTIPFGLFQQDPKPNRVPNAMLTQVGNVPENGLLTDKIRGLMVRMPKNSIEELWIDNLGFYRKKPK